MTTTGPLRVIAATVTTARSIAIVCELLGVPRDDRLLFWRWAGELSSPKTLDELHTYIDVMIADRCREPTDDLLAHMIQLQVDGENLTVDDIHDLVAAVVAGAAD